MPCIWDEGLEVHGIPNPFASARDMPKAAVDPSHAGSHMVHVADLQRGWKKADLSLGQRQVLFLRFALESLLVEIAQDLDINARTVRRRLDTGVAKIGATMNGRPFIENEEEIDEGLD